MSNMQFTNEQLCRIDEIYDAFENAVRVLVQMPQAVRERYGIKEEWDEDSIHVYAMQMADTVAQDLTDWGNRVYFPWHGNAVHDIYDEEE